MSVKLVSPSVPEFDLRDWARRPERERVRMMCESWALEGFGAPLAAYLLYVLKIVAYVWVWVLFVARDPQVAGWSDIGQWWATAAAFQKAIVWTMLFEVLGFGCGSGPLTARYLPPFVAFTHFLRPGTIRLAPWPDHVPLTGGDRRTPVDVLLYAGLLVAGVAALWSPDALTTSEIVPLVVLLPLLGLRDKTVFLAARAEHYWSMLVVFLLAGGDTTVLFAGAIFVQVAIWWGAATSKLNHHFPSVVAIMVSNSPLPHPKALRRAMYRDFPLDLRPSRLAATLAHGGTAIEFLFPLLLLVGDGGALTTLALTVMFLFHLFITTSFPMGVPIEWNVLFVYSMFVLFGAHPEVSVLDLGADPLLLAVLGLGLLSGPVLGNLRPDLVSFLPSMRYYAGNWAASTWLFKPGAEARLDDRLTKTAPTISRQLDILYDDDIAAALKGKVRAFRSMHLHGRAFNAVLNDVVGDPDAWEITDGEPVAGVALGWNFGDGHLSHEQLLEALQARCDFAPGEVRVIALESQPFQRPTLRWRYVDAATGVIASGTVHAADLLDHQPFPEPGTIDLHLDEQPRVGSAPRP